MKILKLITISLTLAPSIVLGNLIDLTPGGFGYGSNYPPEGQRVFNEWFSNVRPSLELFDPNQSYFIITGLGTSSITFSWDLRTMNNGSPHAIFQYLWLLGVPSEPGGVNANLYQVPGNQWRTGEVTITEDFLITSFHGYGRFRVPDVGDSFALLSLALIINVYLYEYIRRREYRNDDFT